MNKYGKKAEDSKKAQKIVFDIIDRAINVSIESDVPFSQEHIDVLYSLNEYCVNHVLNDPEILRDPRKILYKANEEFKTCLVAICLSQSLTNPLRKHKETKEFFIENIGIGVNSNGEKHISFGNIESENVLEAINEEIAEDWKIFRDRDGYGIISLINEKTSLIGLNNYKTGGDMLYEFARFQRKFTEKEKAEEQKARDSAQEAFRNAIVQSMATELAKQQLLEGKNPMDLVEMLFAPNSKKRDIKKLASESKKPNSQIEQQIALMLENKEKKTRTS